jgi:hypothetical protein
VKKAILDDYLEEPTLRCIILYEGRTEETVINQILEALYIDTRRQGIMLYNYEGTGGLGDRNVIGLLNMATRESMPVFVISDNDSGAFDNINHLVSIGKLKPDMYYMWRGDFEQDNFGLSKVLDAVNQRLQDLEMLTLLYDDIEKEMHEGKLLMRAIDAVCNSKLYRKLEDIISKTELATRLMAERIEEIRKEFDDGGWKPKLPIEQVLDKVIGRLERK